MVTVLGLMEVPFVTFVSRVAPIRIPLFGGSFRFLSAVDDDSDKIDLDDGVVGLAGGGSDEPDAPAAAADRSPFGSEPAEPDAGAAPSPTGIVATVEPSPLSFGRPVVAWPSLGVAAAADGVSAEVPAIDPCKGGGAAEGGPAATEPVNDLCCWIDFATGRNPGRFFLAALVFPGNNVTGLLTRDGDGGAPCAADMVPTSTRQHKQVIMRMGKPRAKPLEL
jgi:hypothetical protein